jgi:hypothetical protein
MGLVFKTSKERDDYVKTTFYAPSRPISNRNDRAEEDDERD